MAVAAHTTWRRVMTKRYFIQTFGCQMNIRDSELVAAQFEAIGMQPAATLADADLAFINSCSVRDKAEHKFYSDLGRLQEWKATGGKTIVAGGCVAQQEREKIAKRAPYVDLVIGTHQVRDIAAHLRNRNSKTSVQTAWKHSDPHARLGSPDPARGGKPSVFVTIQEGCDNVCTFCIVPFTRGREVSRPAEAILAEVKAHVAAGAKEIVLLGQNVNSYGHKFPGFPSFAELLHLVHDIQGVERIRFTAPHPKDFGPDVIAAYRDLPKLCASAHIPLQAGSDRILEAMRRGYTSAGYIDLIDALREARPDIHFSTDIIVGFPGELRSDFLQTLAVARRVRFSQVYGFTFSPRPMTPGRDLPDPVAEADKRAWLQELFALQNEIQAADHARAIGKPIEVLWTDHHDGVLKGRSPQGRVVHADGPAGRIGQVIDVIVERATPNAMYGHIAGAPVFS